MSTPLPSTEQLFVQHFQTSKATHPFGQFRQAAIQTFQNIGLPTPKDESYKYTPITRHLAEQLTTPEVTQEDNHPLLTIGHIPEDACRITLVNGKFYSLSGNMPDTIECMTFEEAHQQQHPAFMKHFMNKPAVHEDPLEALNGAFFEEGYFIHISPKYRTSIPLWIEHHTTSATVNNPLVHPRMLIVAGKASEAQIVASWQGDGCVNAATEIVTEEGAHMHYYTLQTDLAPSAKHVQSLKSHQAPHSTCSTYTFTWSGALVRNNLHAVTGGSHTETYMYGLYTLHGKQHIDNCTIVDHQHPHTYSKELYKGIIAGHATGIFNGRIYVQPDAQKTNAFQTNNNLLLSDQATLHTKPQLEIWADDVKCSHGTTTGQLDSDQLFYLQSRGLPKKKAQKLLQKAFVNEIIEQVKPQALRDIIYKAWEAQEERNSEQ